ncbi:type IV pili methyl-accepting chemotaxis transducer N-terminal domain-containing protein [Halarcobacter sp.]|uniref:type IV pili methyl-accepting chemotaxis transducer N-terminal domain-containing protein n=1 Tax=Halarcobacter TaxID=2321115 RepID=UPI003A904555
MKKVSVSQKIKIIGALLILSIFTVIVVTIFLNHKNVKDATIVNIAGKQRMLTQRITKNIYFLYQNKQDNFTEIDNAIEQFNYGLGTLISGDKLLGISAAPTEELKAQMTKVVILWTSFEKNVREFKEALLKNDTQKLNSTIKFINNNNNRLLQEVDQVVTLYTKYIEEKTAFIKKFQYLAFTLLLLLAIYSIIQLRQIEQNAREFIEKSKKISSGDINELTPININTEKEFVEVADNMNNFINKVSSAMNYSQTALEQSKKASQKLESLTEEFDDLINDFENKSDVIKGLDRSEDIMIESTEDLIKTTKRLQSLKTQLDSLIKKL